jgi:hypothetical protein
MLFAEKGPAAADAKKKAEMEAPANDPKARLKGMSYDEGAAELSPKEDAAPVGGSLNPFKWGKEVQAFMDFVNRVTANKSQRISQEDFDKVVKSYKSLNTMQKYSASNAMHSGGYSGLEGAIRANDYGLTELDSL